MPSQASPQKVMPMNPVLTPAQCAERIHAMDTKERVPKRKLDMGSERVVSARPLEA
jgi:hypothetical protein